MLVEQTVTTATDDRDHFLKGHPLVVHSSGCLISYSRKNNTSYNLAENFSLGEPVTETVVQTVTTRPQYLRCLVG